MTVTSAPVDRRELFATARAEALFASDWQPSEVATSDQIRAVVRRTVSRHGVRGCAAQVAYEFGEHPHDAAERMQSAARTVAAVFPARDYIWARS
jgi:hypothetical protein